MLETRSDWFAENRVYLMDYIEYIKSFLAKLVSQSNGEPKDDTPELWAAPKWTYGSEEPSIESIATTFHLSNFEKNFLVLCIGAEIDGQISTMCSRLYGNPSNEFPTFDMARRALPEASWKAILPDSNLRRFQLINLRTYDDTPLITAPVRVHERILHHVLGFKNTMDASLEYILTPIQLTAPVSKSVMDRMPEFVGFYEKRRNMGSSPTICLWGSDPIHSVLVAQRIAEAVGFGLWNISADAIPSKSSDEQSLSNILSRECLLNKTALYIDANDFDESLRKAIAGFGAKIIAPLVFIGSRHPWQSLARDMPFMVAEVKRPTRNEQRELWNQCIECTMQDDEAKLHYLNEVDKIVNMSNLDEVSIEAICKNVSGTNDKEGSNSITRLYSILQGSTYKIAKTRLGNLAEEIAPIAKMEDLILPANKKNMIKTIAIHFKQRRKVYDEWGFAKKNSRGLGIIALFSGESGTGKTMAAEAIANELGLDIYKIDLSMVASKYIGETEKNLRQIFDAAETNESILFFDEADSLFGKRSEVKDSHDRYANIQISYLLQRIETYEGIVILATNFKKSLDSAFMRRLRFIVDFPFPDEKSREEIWRRSFPEKVPLDNLDFKFLSRLSITGGNIWNIALNAAFLAASEGAPISMTQIKQAAEDEYSKLGRVLSSSEIGNWP